MPSVPSVRTLLDALPDKARLLELARHARVAVPGRASRDELALLVARAPGLSVEHLVAWMGRDELRAACQQHGLPATSRARQELGAALLAATAAPITRSVAPGHDDEAPVSLPPASLRRALSDAPPTPDGLPTPGAIALVRRRQHLVEAVTPGLGPDEATRVDLVCLDDDAQGQPLSVLWELELGARVLSQAETGLGPVSELDPPRTFAAYLHALKWSQVTATRSDLFQAPFRAGIKLLDHQLTPLKKALELPRANLFIADDVGLGKTIEAGLVMSELELRQRVSFVLVVCPASICLQWKGEMERRFGQRFEIMGRDFMARRRRERGFGVPAWSTHNRFIVSYQTLRRPEYREPLLVHLGRRLVKSLLVLDEAHTAAPASAGRTAIDSAITAMIRDEVAPRFENRLFLSATPHNGHSNSFSALLAMLDPQRFTRGVPIESGSRSLAAVMVRRLKRDLSTLGKGDFPVRHVVRVPVGSADAPEVELSRLLAAYTDLRRSESDDRSRRERGPVRPQLVFIHLQKRLLSSVEAFHRTLSAHAEKALAGLASASTGPSQALLDLRPRAVDEAPLGDVPGAADEDAHGATDEELDAADAHAVATASVALAPVSSSDGAATARVLLEQMLDLARKHRARADAKVTALVAWIREQLLDGKTWRDRRVLLFTEYGDTMRYLQRTLAAALDPLTGGDVEERIALFHGGMGDDARAGIQEAFNGDPAEHPVRVLIATDAAREGLNLQNHCADLFHVDVPWNPARMEQRNGRIDRTLQPAKVVRCHYFVYPDRAEDAVLDKLVEKVGVIHEELGSLGEVVMEKVEKTLARGIDRGTLVDLDAATAPPPGARTAKEELESQRELKALKKEIDEARTILQRSRQVLDFQEDLLRDAIDVGLELSGAAPLARLPHAVERQPAYELPALGPTWARTVDTLRRARKPDEPEWEWRKDPPLPVVFKALDRMGESRVHLHLEHPFVQRVLARFHAQGFGAHDLSRVTVVPDDRHGEPRALAIGRLSLFGPGAARLHDELVAVAAPFRESGDGDHLVPRATDDDRRAFEHLEQLLLRVRELPQVPAALERRLAASAAVDFRALWRHVEDEADGRAHAAAQLLEARGEREADALRAILVAQRAAIQKQVHAQLDLFSDLEGDAQRKARDQAAAERESMKQRLDRIDREIADEPDQLRALFAVSLRRLTPVGLVYLWPVTST